MPETYRLVLPNCEQLEVGDYIGDDGVDDDLWVPVMRSCPLCGQQMERASAHNHFTVIKEVLGPKTYRAVDLPVGHVLLGCRRCVVYFNSAHE